MATLLIERGAAINIQENRGLTPIYLAARSGNLNLVKILIERGADPNAKIRGVWVTPLSWSAENGFADVVNYLLDKGAEADTGSVQLKRFAVTKGLVKLFHTLQEKNASFNLWKSLNISCRKKLISTRKTGMDGLPFTTLYIMIKKKPSHSLLTREVS